MSEGYFGRFINAAFGSTGKQAESVDSLDTTSLDDLDDEGRHKYLLAHPEEREIYFQERPQAQLRYYRKEPQDLREHLKKRVETDEEFSRWTKKAGYDLSDDGLDLIVLGLLWVGDEFNDAGEVVKEEHPGRPFVVSRDLMKEGHMHVRGRTRSGKSALAITPLIQQLIRPYTITERKTKQVIKSDCKDAIFVIDMGGDLALFNFARKQAKQHRRDFKFLSLESEDAWSYFDPFEAAKHGDDRIIRIAILLQKAFSLDHGLAYAASYFSSRNLSSLLDVARKLSHKNRSMPGSVSLEEISRHLDEANVKDAEEIRMIFQFLTEYEQLKPFDVYDDSNPMDERIINLERALDNGEVVYFLLPTLSESMTARQIAGLALYTLINAAQQRHKKVEFQEGRPAPHAWVFVDEFQQLAGSSYADVLAQASKFGLSLIMANQTTTQLDVRNLNLADIVRDNTFAKLYFTVTGEQDINAIKSFSKEARGVLESSSHSPSDIGLRGGLQEYLTTVLQTDEILSTSSTNQHCFLLLDDGTGHREPIRLWTDYAMDYEEFRTLKSTPPKKRKHRQRPKISESEPLWKIALRKSPKSDWSTPLASILAKKRKEEGHDKIAT